MKASEAQAVIASLLAAVTSVNQFAPFIVEDGITNNESVVDAALEAKGACIAIDEVEGAEADSASNNRAALATAQITVVVFDQPAVAHTPSRLALIEDVVAALTANSNFKLQGFTRYKREKGGVAAVVDFTANVLFR